MLELLSPSNANPEVWASPVLSELELDLLLELLNSLIDCELELELSLCDELSEL